MDSPWSKLPADLKAEIIWRLPVKVMVRLKLVSKDWLFVISRICIPRISPPSPPSTFCGFICHMLYNRSSRVDVQFIGYGYYRRFMYNSQFFEKYYYGKLPFELNSDDVQDCCNGFLLLVHSGVYYVCNPTTFQCIEIPHNPLQHDGAEPATYIASLVFDPTKSLHFKIISATTAVITNPLRVDIFSSDKCKWSSQLIMVDDCLIGVEWGYCSVYLNGVVYRTLSTNYLLSIDLRTSSADLRLRAIQLPTDDTIKTRGTIGTSRGCLYYSNSDQSRLQIWMLKDGVEWILKHWVSLDYLYDHLDERMLRIVDKLRGRDCFKFYAFHPDQDELFLVTPFVILCYHFVARRVELFDVIIAKRIHLDRNCFLPYSRSPILLDLSGFHG